MSNTMKKLYFALLLFANQAFAISPFTSDGCSMFPDGTLKEQEVWLSCCTAHDLAYWQGGTKEQRLAADKALQQCVTKVNHPNIANLMLQGVRVGGSPYLPTSFRWGYGWPFPRGYQALSELEQQQVGVELAKAKLALPNLL
jgi:hypothetical protein